MKKTEQKILFGEGTVEQREKGLKMFEALAEMFGRSIIGHRGWEKSITEEQKQRIQVERLKQVAQAKGSKIEMATDYECLVYLSTASLSMPLSSMWTRIYMYLFKKFYPDKSDFIPEHEAQLHIQDEQELRNLKRWLWKKSKPTR